MSKRPPRHSLGNYTVGKGPPPDGHALETRSER